jgi:hypothetical protein
MAVGFHNGWRVRLRVRSGTSSLACDARYSSRFRAMTLYPGSMHRSGARLVLALAGLFLTGCLYHFAGGGLPPHIKSVAVLPFDNETPQPTLQRELYDLMRRDVENRLGLREAAEGKADAIVRGKILRYDPDIPAAYSADRNAQATTTERKLQITFDVEIVDQTTGRTLWTRKGMLEEGTYAERAEADGRRQALTKVVNDIIAGAQSQW